MSFEIVDDTTVLIDGREFKFRHPDEWTVGEVAKVQDESTVYVEGNPVLKMELLMQKTIARACKMSEKEAAALPYHVGFPLYQIVRWHPAPLGNLRTLSAEPRAETPPSGDSTGPSG